MWVPPPRKHSQLWSIAARWCPIKEAPYLLREKDDDNLRMDENDLAVLSPDIMPVGLVREFFVSPPFYLIRSSFRSKRSGSCSASLYAYANSQCVVL